MKCPCENCICMPICKNKNFNKLFEDCYLLEEFIPNYDNMRLREIDKMDELVKTLNPTGWEYSLIKSTEYEVPLVWNKV